jgi:GNAT superfamily N-acetyltransferase
MSPARPPEGAHSLSEGQARSRQAADPPSAAAARYAREPDLDVASFRRVLLDSGLARIRPVDDWPRLQALLRGANLIVTARRAEPPHALLGVARGVTDFSWCCYLSDLAVSRSAQGLGIGRGLLDAVRAQLGPQVTLTLVSVPEAVGFYTRAGMTPLANAFCVPRTR